MRFNNKPGRISALRHKLANILTLIVFSLLIIPTVINAATGTWTSRATGGNINYTTTEAATPLKDVSGAYMTVVYLENPGFNKIGGNSNATDVAWLLSQGYRVIELDYAKHINAVSPEINKDIIDINDAIFAGSFCGLTTCSKVQSYVLFEGYRIARNVSYFKDNPLIYNYPSNYTVGDSLHMDIIYPSNATVDVPVVLSFSYSNSMYTSKDQRLNLGNTLAGFNDSFLEGAPAKGIAWAIADHPKYCNWGNGKPTGGTNDTYKSYEVNPDAAQKVKSAVRTLRALGENLGLSGKIGIYGFSRGSDAGSMAIGDKSVTEFENAGLNIGVSDDVQVAALGSGVFDFTQIFNATGDGDSNLEYRCPLAWGALATNRAAWEVQGSAYLAETSATAPVIFFYNTDDALYYQDQIAKFKAKLDGLGVTTSTVTNYGTAHAVPQTSASLTTVYNFMVPYLTPPSVISGLENAGILNPQNNLRIYSTVEKSDEIKIECQLPHAGRYRVEITDLSGKMIFKTPDKISTSGKINETIIAGKSNLQSGTYIVSVAGEGVQLTGKFIR